MEQFGNESIELDTRDPGRELALRSKQLSPLRIEQPSPTPIPPSRSRCRAAPFLSISSPFTLRDWFPTKAAAASVCPKHAAIRRSAASRGVC